MASNVCANCGKDLTKLDEVHSVEGLLYCSKDCAIAHQAQVIVNSATDTATEWYNDSAEIVSTRDIGLVYEKKWTAYSAAADITTILLDKYTNKECTELISTEVIGFYYGAPDDKDTEQYSNSLKAEF